jgi:hypothetical protein
MNHGTRRKAYEQVYMSVLCCVINLPAYVRFYIALLHTIKQKSLHYSAVLRCCACACYVCRSTASSGARSALCGPP